MAFLFLFLVLALNLLGLILAIYGIVLSFRKAWYVGLAALVFPLFGFIVGVTKFLGGTDILN
jgi:uncharacterized ion transporter superfamily protein YfcC